MGGLTWALTDGAQTSAGPVAWGRAGQGPSRLLHHGWPWSSYAWHRVIPALAEHFEVFFRDMPGFGRSEMTGQSMGLGAQGRVLAAQRPCGRICFKWRTMIG
ncbi:MAG: alpha/beta fold hydrolase [Pseudomonadota bacterium]